MDGSPKEQGGNDKGGSFSATVNLKCKWTDRYDLLADIIGNQALYPRLMASGARATSGTAKPYPGATKRIQNDYGAADYDFAEVEIQYRLQSETKDLISETLTPSLELVSLDHTRFKWGSTSPSNSALANLSAQFIKRAAKLLSYIGEIMAGDAATALAGLVEAIAFACWETPPDPDKVDWNNNPPMSDDEQASGPSVKEYRDYFTPVIVAAAAKVQLSVGKIDQNVNAGGDSNVLDAVANAANQPNAKFKGTSGDVLGAAKKKLSQLNPNYPSVNQMISENEAPSMRLLGMDYGITFYKVKTLPVWLLTYLGCVNNAPVASKLLGLTFPPGTLMFDTPNMSRKWNFVDFPYWQVEFKLKFRASGWNCYWRSGMNRIVSDTGGEQYMTCGGYDFLMMNVGLPQRPIWVPFVQYPPVDFGVIWSLGGDGPTDFPNPLGLP